MNDEEIIATIKKLVVGGKKIAELCEESGVSRGTIQSLLRDKSSLSLIIRMRLTEYLKRSYSSNSQH